MSIQRHERASKVAKARAAIETAMVHVPEFSDLTTAEIVMILSEITRSWAQFAVKDEREREPA